MEEFIRRLEEILEESVQGVTAKEVCITSACASPLGTTRDPVFESLYWLIWELPQGEPFFRLQLYERLGISRVEVYEGVGKNLSTCRYLKELF